MKRKDFIKRGLLTTIAGLASSIGLNAKTKESKQKSTYDKLMHNVGFNHLPNKEILNMNKVIHRANSRGHANHGWLDSHHSFSFASYYNPERMHFGVLRVLNDDIVSGGRGFSTHPHDNMEIISIPLEGDLEHKDSMGNTAVIKAGDVQVMSAGTGITHSEFNRNKDQEVKFLQIWLFPNKRNVEPRYDQISIRDIEKKNAFYQVLSPNAKDDGVWIHQDAWFSMAKFDAGQEDCYELNRKENGVYLFVLDGEVTVAGEKLSKRDGMGIWNVDDLTLVSDSNAHVLLMEVPMNIG